MLYGIRLAIGLLGLVLIASCFTCGLFLSVTRDSPPDEDVAPISHAPEQGSPTPTAARLRAANMAIDLHQERINGLVAKADQEDSAIDSIPYVVEMLESYAAIRDMCLAVAERDMKDDPAAAKALRDRARTAEDARIRLCKTLPDLRSHIERNGNSQGDRERLKQLESACAQTSPPEP